MISCKRLWIEFIIPSYGQAWCKSNWYLSRYGSFSLLYFYRMSLKLFVPKKNCRLYSVDEFSHFALKTSHYNIVSSLLVYLLTQPRLSFTSKLHACVLMRWTRITWGIFEYVWDRWNSLLGLVIDFHDLLFSCTWALCLQLSWSSQVASHIIKRTRVPELWNRLKTWFLRWSILFFFQYPFFLSIHLGGPCSFSYTLILPHLFTVFLCACISWLQTPSCCFPLPLFHFPLYSRSLHACFIFPYHIRTPSTLLTTPYCIVCTIFNISSQSSTSPRIQIWENNLLLAFYLLLYAHFLLPCIKRDGTTPSRPYHNCRFIVIFLNTHW